MATVFCPYLSAQDTSSEITISKSGLSCLATSLTESANEVPPFIAKSLKNMFFTATGDIDILLYRGTLSVLLITLVLKAYSFKLESLSIGSNKDIYLAAI